MTKLDVMTILGLSCTGPSSIDYPKRKIRGETPRFVQQHAKGTTTNASLTKVRNQVCTFCLWMLLATNFKA